MHTKAATDVAVVDASKGRVQAVFATLNVIDKDADVTLAGAFDDGQKVRISAWNHGSWKDAPPVGKGTIRVTGDQAIFDGGFFMSTPHGRDAFEVVKELDDLAEWSYGYDILESEQGEWLGRKVQLLKRLKVHEVSPVMLGAGMGTRTLMLASHGGSVAPEYARTVETLARATVLRAPELQPAPPPAPVTLQALKSVSRASLIRGVR